MDEISRSMKGYLRIFLRRKWSIINLAFVGLVLGICAVLLLPKVYKSSSTILVQEGKTDNPLFNNLAVSSTITERAQAIREIMLGWDSLSILVKRLNLDQEAKSGLEYEKIIKELRKDIDISLREGNIIDLSYVSNDPKRSQAVVQAVTDIYIDRNRVFQNKATSDAINFIEEQLHVYQGKIKSAEIANLKDKLNILLVDSTEEHPLVRDLRAQINKKMQELKNENLQYSEDKQLNMETNSPMIEQIRGTLDSLTDKQGASTASSKAPGEENDIYKVMLINNLDKVMARDVNVNEAIYNSLLQRLETAKITQRLESSKEGTKYVVLNPPQIPLRPISPNAPLVIIFGFLLGACSGVALVIMQEFSDKSFFDAQEASQFLGAPMLGVITKIHTPESIKAEQRKNALMLISMTLFCVLLVLVSIKIRTLIKV